MREILHRIEEDISTSGLDVLSDFPQGDLARFRPPELAAALNRLRSRSIADQ